MFGTLLTAAYTMMLSYLLWRAGSVPALKDRFSRKEVIGFGAALWVFFFLARVFDHQTAGAAAGIFEFIGMTLLGMTFIFSTTIFVVDLCTLFGFACSRWRSTLFGWAMAAGVILTAIAFIQGMRAPAVSFYRVTLPNLPAEFDGTVIVAVSDTHLGTLLGTRWLSERVAQIEALKPDLLVFLGDIFEGHGGRPPDVSSLGTLNVPLGKWFVDGNHESRHDSNSGIRALERAGFRRLDNEWSELAPGIVLSGVSDLTNHRRRKLDGDPMAKATAGRPPGAAVLLSHTPWQAEFAAAAGVGLMLSGHTHGGQIWPFGHLVETVYPIFVGRYDINGMTAIVGRGTGTWGPRMRLWHRGEILRIELEAPRNLLAK